MALIRRKKLMSLGNRQMNFRRSGPFVLSVLLLAGLTACGQNTATAEDGTENAAEAQALAENAAASTVTEDTGSTAPAAAVETAAASTPAPAAATVAALPLRRGYYVASDSPCNQASRADVAMLLTRMGTNLNCTFKKIEKTGATTYKVTEECVHDGSSWGHED